MKRLLICTFLIFVIFLAVFSGGFVYYKNIGNVSIFFDGKNVLSQNVSIDISKYLEVRIRSRGNYLRHYRNVCQGNPIEYLSNLDYRLSQNLLAIKEDYDVQKIEPYYEYTGQGRFAFYEGIRGLDIDIDALALLIIKNISSSYVISLPYKYIEIETSYADLVSRTQKLSCFSTNYATSSTGRKNNVKLATERLDGAVILPNETLSFNSIVGERTESNGFMMAKIIQNGEFIEGVGGGVCQVSTTLYNACLLSGMDVDRSATHSLPVSYVSPSLDAMVSSTSDLIVKNKSAYPMYIYGHCDGKKISFEVFGYGSGYKIKLRSTVIRELPCEEYEIIALDIIPDGAEVELVIEKAPVNGLVSEGYRDYFDGDKLVFTERLRRSIYAPQKGIKYKKVRTAQAKMAEIVK